MTKVNDGIVFVTGTTPGSSYVYWTCCEPNIHKIVELMESLPIITVQEARKALSRARKESDL